jgi:hypothetical protein
VGPETNNGVSQFACEATGIPGPPFEARWRYGGSFQIGDGVCGGEGTMPNPLTGALSCPPGYAAAPFGRIKNPEGSQCGVTQFVCTITRDTPPQDFSFGGMHQNKDLACTSDPPLPPPSDSGPCAAGFESDDYGRILTPEEPQCGATQTFCSGPANPSSQQFGGIFEVFDLGGGVGNELAGGQLLCPTGYTPILFARVLDPEDGTGASQFYCAAPPGFTQPGMKKFKFGGAFQVDDCGQSHRRNPLTGTVGCPSGYTTSRYGRVKGAELAQCGIEQFFCFRPTL